VLMDYPPSSYCLSLRQTSTSVYDIRFHLNFERRMTAIV
jgi:hypothetical protein